MNLYTSLYRKHLYIIILQATFELSNIIYSVKHCYTAHDFQTYISIDIITMNFTARTRTYEQ